ncbi:MAG: hypothetical protein HYT81_14360 [Gemmatimonadetes bacterium]|nr:hypothetical protein [Gemmatimonadota bacterium]
MRLGTFGRVLALAAIAVLAGVGLCLFDTDDTASGDLCLSSFATTSGLLLAIPLALTGRFLPGFAAVYYCYPPDLPAPPPKA